MSKTALSKSELAKIVRQSIRQHDGCDGAETIILHEVSLPKARWEIAVIVASTGDPDAIQSAAKKVQEELQVLYRVK